MYLPRIRQTKSELELELISFWVGIWNSRWATDLELSTFSYVMKSFHKFHLMFLFSPRSQSLAVDFLCMKTSPWMCTKGVHLFLATTRKLPIFLYPWNPSQVTPYILGKDTQTSYLVVVYLYLPSVIYVAQPPSMQHGSCRNKYWINQSIAY